MNTTAGVSSEHLDYTRNLATQNKSRTICSLYPSFTFKILPTKKAGEQLEFQLMYEQSASSIFDMLDYTDDAVPQIVKLGNPNLKGYASSTFNVNFTDRESKRRQQYNLNGNFRYYHRQVAQSVVYNPTNPNTPTSQRMCMEHTKPMHSSATCNRSSGSMTAGLGRQRLMLSTVRWRHSEGKMRDFTTLDAFDYQYGLMARYTLPDIKTTLSADANIYSRRGYGSKTLNTDDFVMNASVSQPFLKGKLIATWRSGAFALLGEGAISL